MNIDFNVPKARPRSGDRKNTQPIITSNMERARIITWSAGGEGGRDAMEEAVDN
jgi:hypothetical protein